MNGKFELKDIISWIMAFLGAIASILAAFFSSIVGFSAIFSSILATQLLLSVIWIMILRADKKKEKNLAELRAESDALKGSIDQCKKDADLMRSENEKHISLIRTSERVIALNIKNASKLYNEFCARLPGITDKAYHVLETLQESEIDNQELLQKEIAHSYEELALSMFDVYRRYSTNLLSYLVTIEEAYLRSRGYTQPVAATIKLFNIPYCLNGERSKILVYTAFRDKATYDASKREVGLEPYTIDGNNDFVQCLRKDHFIINNAKRGSDNYLNEHKDFDAYYNCAIVVPIRIKQPDNSYQYLGYMCCDYLNAPESCDEVFDVQSAYYLFAMAQLFATYFDALESNWMERMEAVNGLPKTFQELVYQKTYRGKTVNT